MTSWARSRQSSLVSRWLTWVFTVPYPRWSWAAISWLERPWWSCLHGAAGGLSAASGWGPAAGLSGDGGSAAVTGLRSEEHTSESSHGSLSYAVFCFKKKQ